MDVSKVEIHTGDLDRPYREIAYVQARRSKGSVFGNDPSYEEVNAELRQQAAELGANAVLDCTYKRGMSLFSYGVLTATGLAVFVEADEVVCPSCAETVKRAAVKCKHCGEKLSPS